MKKLIILSALMGTFTVAHAQTTGTELKAQIDTDITNKTGAGSITKTAVGNNMKDIVDYVDQQTSGGTTPDAQAVFEQGSEIALPVQVYYTIGTTTPTELRIHPTLTTLSTNTINFNARTAFNMTTETGNSALLNYVPIITRINGEQAEANGDIQVGGYEWSAQVSQTGTGAPIPQATAVNTIEGVGFGEDQYRELVWARTGVGTYTVKLYYTAGNLDVSKIALYTPYNVKITAKNDGSDGGGPFRQYTFQSVDNTGTPADDLLTGNNGGYFNIRIYQ